MAITYEPITTQSVSDSVINLNSISTAYTDLRLVFSGYISSAGTTKIYFNGDTTDSNYRAIFQGGDGNSVSASYYSVPWIYIWAPSANRQFNFIIDMNSYQQVNYYKTYIARVNMAGGGSATEGGSTQMIGAWYANSGSSINSIRLQTSTGSLNGTVTLYGIKGA